MNDDFIDTIVGDLESTAHWRREKATEYPNDERNDTAANILECLAGTIQAVPRSEAIIRLRNLNEELVQRGRTEKNFNFSGLIIECSDYHRRIGFSEFPNTEEEYLATLAALYRGQLNRTREGGLNRQADGIRQLRMAAVDLRSEVSQGSYGELRQILSASW